MDRKEPGEDRAIDPRPLTEKALERAIQDILTARDRTEANSRYKSWEVFHTTSQFIKAVKIKQQSLKS